MLMDAELWCERSLESQMRTWPLESSLPERGDGAEIRQTVTRP